MRCDSGGISMYRAYITFSLFPKIFFDIILFLLKSHITFLKYEKRRN
jgi:hypothetical protein